MLILLNYPYFFKEFQVSDNGKGNFFFAGYRRPSNEFEARKKFERWIWCIRRYKPVSGF
jgi:hypothetical protein